MLLNHMICPTCEHDFYVDAHYATCPACQTHFYAALSLTCNRNDRRKELAAGHAVVKLGQAEE